MFSNELRIELSNKISSMEEKLRTRDCNGGEKQVCLPYHRWVALYEDKIRSPKIMRMSDNTYMLHFPCFSEPYVPDKIINKKKKITILEGTLYDKASGTTYEAGKVFEVYPEDSNNVYTEEEYCLAVSQLIDL